MEYALVYVTLRNYRTHDHLDMKFNGKSYVLVGDTELGKSSVLEAIKVAHKYTTFPPDALKQGAKEGTLEIGIMIDGEPYRVSCDFDESGRGRWRVRSEGRGSFTLEEVLRKMFVGLATKGTNSAYFDYSEYFFQAKSPAARFEYLMSCLLGEIYHANKRRIEMLEKERGSFGTKRELLAPRVQASGITPETFEELLEKFKEDKTLKKAEADRAKALKKIQPAEELEELLQAAKEQNEAARLRAARLKELKERELAIAQQLAMLNKQMGEVETEIQFLEEENEKFPEDPSEEREFERQLQELEAMNEKVEKEAEMAFNKAREEISQFNRDRASFLRDKQDYEQYHSLDDQWNKLQNEIRQLRQANVQAIKEQIKVPGLEIREVEKTVKGETVLEQHVYYDGRELNFDNVSKGKSISIATEIQKAVNPDGFPLILLPEAQSLGSALSEVITEAHAQGYQVIAEFTEPHRNLEAVILEDFLEQKEEEEKVLADLRAKKATAGVPSKPVKEVKEKEKRGRK